MSRKNTVFLVVGLAAIPAVFLVIDHAPLNDSKFNNRPSVTLANSPKATTTQRDSQQRTIARLPDKQAGKARAHQEPEPSTRDLNAQTQPVVPPTALEFPTSVWSAPSFATPVSDGPITVASLPPGVPEHLHSVAEGKTFAIRLQRAQGDLTQSIVPMGVYAPQDSFAAEPDNINVQSSDATLYCNAFEIVSERVQKESGPSLSNSQDDSQSSTPPTEALVENDEAAPAIASPAPPSEEAEEIRSDDTLIEARPNTTDQPVTPGGDDAKEPDHGDSDIEFTCQGQVSLVIHTSLIKAANLSYADGKFQFSNAVVTTPLGEFTAPTLSLTFPLDGLHIQRASFVVDAVPSFEAARVPPPLMAPRGSFPGQ